MDGFPFVHRETVRFRDLDGFGHVNNAVYLTYLEQARIAFFLDVDMIRDASEEEMSMILARVEIDFRATAVTGDVLDVGVRPGRVGGKSFELEYAIRRGDDLLAEARTVLVAFDYDRAESVTIPDEWRRRLT